MTERLLDITYHALFSDEVRRSSRQRLRATLVRRLSQRAMGLTTPLVRKHGMNR